MSSVDMFGRDLKLGDIFVYPVRRGSDTELKYAVVCEVPGEGCAFKKGIVGLNARGRRVIVQRPERCAIICNIKDKNSANVRI